MFGCGGGVLCVLVGILIGLTVDAAEWREVGSLHVDRNYHTATLLPDGTVLAVGGNGGSGSFLAFDTCERYDPATEAWTMSTNLIVGRAAHAAALLPSGHVLVAGGNDCDLVDCQATDTGELYDPTTETWTATARMETPRAFLTGTLFASGDFLVAGGYGNDGHDILASAEILDGDSGNWRSVASLNTERYYHTATLMSDGRVLVVGGYGNYTTQRSAELFDPATEAWTSTDDMLMARQFHTATLLWNGEVLVAGGTQLSVFTERYNPSTGRWSVAAGLTKGRVEHTATLMPYGRVLVTGGSAPANRVEYYEPQTDRWLYGVDMHTARVRHTATLLADGNVLVTGGLNYHVTLASAEVFLPNENYDY